MPEKGHLTTDELAARWQMNAGTLRNWRSEGIGPRYFEVGRRGRKRKPRIRYRLAEIERYEKQNEIKTANGRSS